MRKRWLVQYRPSSSAHADDPVLRDILVHVERFGILDAPLSRGMTAVCSGGVIPNIICDLPLRAHRLVQFDSQRLRRARSGRAPIMLGSTTPENKALLRSEQEHSS